MLPPRPISRVVRLTEKDLIELPPPKPPSTPPPLPPKQDRAPRSEPVPMARIAESEGVRAMHDMLRDLDDERDALSATRTCLDALQRAMPCRLSLAHAFDERRGDFIVVQARGEGADAIILERSSKEDPLLRVAMPKGEVFPWNDLRKAPVNRLARFAELGPVTSVLVSPLMCGPRWLGALELVDSVGGAPFGTRDVLSARYVAGRLARFLAAHGVVLDVATIARFAADTATHGRAGAAGCTIDTTDGDDVSRRARSIASATRGNRAASA